MIAKHDRSADTAEGKKRPSQALPKAPLINLNLHFLLERTMEKPNDPLDELMALAASPARRLRPDAAAKYVGYSVRALEDWRRSWRVAEQEGQPELRWGPKFVKIGNRVLYEVR